MKTRHTIGSTFRLSLAVAVVSVALTANGNIVLADNSEKQLSSIFDTINNARDSFLNKLGQDVRSERRSLKRAKDLLAQARSSLRPGHKKHKELYKAVIDNPKSRRLSFEPNSD